MQNQDCCSIDSIARAMTCAICRSVVARMARLDLEGDGETTATVAVPGGSVEIRAGELVDREAEARKAQADRERLRKEIARAESRLANEGFVAKAPPDLVLAERDGAHSGEAQ